MYKFYSILLFAFFAMGNSLFAQEYFQQEVNYKIDVKLNDKVHEFSAFETVEYINNSPDELEFIYFHLWPNAYSNNETALAKQKLKGSWSTLFKNEELRGYIDSLDFKVDNKTVKWELDKEHIDICKIILDKPLKPGEKIIISTPFHVKIPKGVTSRLGHIKESYQISQWYPKLAVYDKYGWHQMPYLNMGEFYSEFGSFDVSITLPKNYVVGATGDLQNPEEIEWLTELAEKTVKIDSFDKTDLSFPESSKEFKTIRFKQSNIHDFAWFADKRFNVLKGEQVLPASGRKVTTWSMFLNSQANYWVNSLEYIGDALHYYSLYTGDYPYNNCTAVHSALSAGGGMEYPNITVIGNAQSARMLELVIIHEVGHNWFYGILGFNERDYPWLDEGLNTFCEARYMSDKYGDDDGASKLLEMDKLMKFLELDGLRYKRLNELFYLRPARLNIDQSASLHSAEYSSGNYGDIIYRKVPKVFDYLMGYLGEDKFNEIMISFYEDWKYKHPYPEDVIKAFKDGTGEDLSWMFDDLMQTTKKLDYKFVKANKTGFVLKNTGKIVGPITITAYKDDKILFNNWYPGFSGKKKFEVDLSSVDKLVMDPDGYMPDFIRANNTIKPKGIFKKTEPLRFRFAGAIENNDKTQINFVPAVGWNNYNKFMLGMAFYQSLIPRNKFEYQIMPMYSFGTNDVAGSANIAYNIMPYDSKIQNLKLKATGMQYAYGNNQGDNFQRYKLEANFTFRKKDPTSRINNNLIINTIIASSPVDIVNSISPDLNHYYNINFIHNNWRAFYPYSVNVGTQINKDFVKSDIVASYRIKFAKKKSIRFRLFAGMFLYKTNNLSPLYYMNLSGASGVEDYTYDEAFLGRYENPEGNSFISRQFIPNDGAFTTYTAHGKTNEWLVSLNVNTSIPYLPSIIPLTIYANVAAFGNTQEVVGYTDLDNYAWEAGLRLSLAGGGINIYVPLIQSKDLKTISNDIHPNFTDNIRFSFSLNSYNPSKMLGN